MKFVDSRRLVVAATWASALGMLLATAGTVSATCEISVASHLFEDPCRPFGFLVNVGHAIAAAGAIPLALALRRGMRIELWLALFGATTLALVAAIHLALAIGVADQGAALWPLVSAWALVGLWIVGRSLPRMVPTTSVLGAVLGVTAIAWAMGFQGAVANDAVRLAGGGLFAVGFVLWIAWATGRWSGAPPGRGIVLSRDPVLAWGQRITVSAAGLLLALPALAVWMGATCGVVPLPSDPLVEIEVRNETSSTLSGRSVTRNVHSLPQGAVDKLHIGIGGPRDIDYSLTDSIGRVVRCRASAYETLKVHSRFVITGDPPVCILDTE